jgi:hypothetical protein
MLEVEACQAGSLQPLGECIRNEATVGEFVVSGVMVPDLF